MAEQLSPGVTLTCIYRVRRCDLVCFQYRHGGLCGWIRYLWLSVFGLCPQPFAGEWRGKPKVQSTGNLIGVLEWAAMKAIRPSLLRGEDCLGTGVDIRHVAPVWRATILEITAQCVDVDGRRSAWSVHAGYYTSNGALHTVAEGVLGFSVVRVDSFLHSRAPSRWVRWRAKPRWRHRVWVGSVLPVFRFVTRFLLMSRGKHRVQHNSGLTLDEVLERLDSKSVVAK